MEMSPSRVPFLFGEYDLTLDSKNRISVPSEIRNRLIPEIDGQALFVNMRGKIPCMYPELYYERLVNSEIPTGVTLTDDLLAYQQMKFAMASRVEWDSQGRIVLSEKLLRRSGLAKETKELTLIGMRDHLQLWNRDDWERRRDQLEQEGDTIENRARNMLSKMPSNRAGTTLLATNVGVA